MARILLRAMMRRRQLALTTPIGVVGVAMVVAVVAVLAVGGQPDRPTTPALGSEPPAAAVLRFWSNAVQNQRAAYRQLAPGVRRRLPQARFRSDVQGARVVLLRQPQITSVTISGTSADVALRAVRADVERADLPSVEFRLVRRHGRWLIASFGRLPRPPKPARRAAPRLRR